MKKSTTPNETGQSSSCTEEGPMSTLPQPKKEFEDNQNLAKEKRGIKIHSKSKQAKITHEGQKHSCNICKNEFVSKSSVNEGPKYSCDICKHEYTDKLSVKRHKANKHGIKDNKNDTYRFKCDICNRLFQTK